MLNGYKPRHDGYTENPLAHYENATAAEVEGEYFMQWVHPLRLQRVALRTPIGYRLTYLYAKDLWNNRIGIKLPDDEDKAKEINKKLVDYLISRHYFREMEKLTAFEREQGEAILLCYYGDGIENFKTPVKDTDEILMVEALSPMVYNIERYDEKGEPKIYRVQVKTPNSWKGYETVEVHPSRILRKMASNIEWRDTGYSDLAAIYDSINILSSIVKSSGEAAYRWATGRPLFLTKDLQSESELTKLKNGLNDFSRRAWIALPSEKIEKIEMLGQAGSMLNLKSLADICIEQIIIGTGFPKTIMLGEVAGVMGSEVQERSYFALLDRDHTELEYFVRMFFEKDINIKKLFKGIEEYLLDWGIREVFNKMDDAEYKQKMISVAVTSMELLTVDECRKIIGMKGIGDDKGGDVIMGLLPYIELQMQMNIMMGGGGDEPEDNVDGRGSESETSTSVKQKSQGAQKKAASNKEPEKNKRVAPPTRDSIDELKMNLADNLEEIKGHYSMNDILKELNIYDKTFYKLLDWAKTQKNKKTNKKEE